jgi:hypothetical protein
LPDEGKLEIKATYDGSCLKKEASGKEALRFGFNPKGGRYAIVKSSGGITKILISTF